MVGFIHTWLKGNREYYTGLAILKACGADASLVTLLSKGHSSVNKAKLVAALEAIAQPSIKIVQQNPIPKKVTVPPPTVTDYSHTDLYKACKKEADVLYKQVMNERAVLFNSLKHLLPHEDANTPDLIEKRRKPAINIVADFIRVSKLYDRAAYVKQHGKLPHDSGEEAQPLQADGIPDAMVKQKLDNLRKAYNKNKHKEPTPERIERMNKQLEEIKLLEARWQLLKPSI